MLIFALCLCVSAPSAMLLAGCRRKSETPPPPEVALTAAQTRLVAMRQALEGDGRWQQGALAVEAGSVMVEPDGTLVLGSRGAAPGVVMRRVDEASGKVQVEFRASSIRYLARDANTIECRMSDVTTTNPDTGDPVHMAELHFEIPVVEAPQGDSTDRH